MFIIETKYDLILLFIKVLILLQTVNKVGKKLLFLSILTITHLIGKEKNIKFIA